MPQTTPERAKRWPGMDSEAIEFLEDAGYTLRKDWAWDKPSKNHKPTERERDAVIYLIEEWDFDGIERNYVVEPTVKYATVRDGDDEWHVECRFSDGQKYAAVTVDKPFEKLAHKIATFLNENQSEFI